jgi:hypothetical protein
VYNLEGRAAIVVEAAHETRLYFIRYAAIIQVVLNGREMVPAAFVEAVEDGWSESMIGWSCGTLQSSTRNGFVSARRWQSLHIVAATSLRRSRKAATKTGRQSGQPTELIRS